MISRTVVVPSYSGKRESCKLSFDPRGSSIVEVQLCEDPTVKCYWSPFYGLQSYWRSWDDISCRQLAHECALVFAEGVR